MPEYHHCPEVERKLREKGYYVSLNYGLILKNEDGEYVIADIRGCEKKIVFPLIEKNTETQEGLTLKKILNDEHITFRDKSRTSD
jgi:hypothetical protein